MNRDSPAIWRNIGGSLCWSNYALREISTSFILWINKKNKKNMAHWTWMAETERENESYKISSSRRFHILTYFIYQTVQKVYFILNILAKIFSSFVNFFSFITLEKTEKKSGWIHEKITWFYSLSYTRENYLSFNYLQIHIFFVKNSSSLSFTYLQFL